MNSAGRFEKIAEVVEHTVEESKLLLVQELQLLRVECTEQITSAVQKVSRLACAFMFALIGVTFLCLALVRGFEAMGLPSWASYLSSALLLFGAALFIFKSPWLDKKKNLKEGVKDNEFALVRSIKTRDQ